MGGDTRGLARWVRGELPSYHQFLMLVLLVNERDRDGQPCLLEQRPRTHGRRTHPALRLPVGPGEYLDTFLRRRTVEAMIRKDLLVAEEIDGVRRYLPTAKARECVRPKGDD